MRFLLTLCLIPLFYLLTGCSPVYQTTYTYTAPKDQTGKMCAMQCEQNKSLCQQLCDSKVENCRNSAKQMAAVSYAQYKNDRTTHGQPVDKTINDFYSDSQCNNQPCNCTENYNTCFTVCGGQITPNTVCVAFCDKK